MNRYPHEVEVLWSQSRPLIELRLNDKTKPIILRAGPGDEAEQVAELLKAAVNKIAGLMLFIEKVKWENRDLRQKLRGTDEQTKTQPAR